MWLAFDIETYEQWDGTEKSAKEIRSQMITDGDREEFDKIKIQGNFYPVLNSRKFVMGCVVTDAGERLSFYDHKKMLRWLVKKIEDNAKKGEKTYLYAHNISYDILGLIKDNPLALISTDLNLVSDSPFLASWKVDGKNWGFFVDTFSFFRGMNVATIGNILGLEKLHMPEQIKDPHELEEYCMRDCEVVLNGMLYLKDKLKVLGFSPRKFLTAGQVAMSTFMSHIRRENIHWNIMRSGEVYKGANLEKCRPAYRGARNEAFTIGEVKGITSIDINSLYPYAMTKLPFPKLDEEMFVKKPLEKSLTIGEMLNKKWIGCMECEVEVPEIELGYLPIRHNKILHFPEGKRVLKGTWTTFELRKALDLGYKIKDVFWVCLYPVLKENVFDSYINRLYDLRKESGDEMKLAVKLIMNNLYGKFAQFRMNKEYKVIFRSELTGLKKKGWKVKSVWGNKYIIEKYNDLYVPKYTNLMIAILITAYGRDYLYDFLSKIKRSDLVYCDTDGIVLKNWDKYKDQFVISEEMGDWKIVVENQDGFVKGEKNYRVGEKIKTSGVNKRLLVGIDYDNTQKLIQKRRVGIKDALNNPKECLSLLGSFKDYEINFKMSGKKDVVLPEVIDERREWINIFD